MAIDALIITVSVCLFSYLGLKDEVLFIYDKITPQNSLICSKIRNILTCTKCLSFWITLLYNVASGYIIIGCVLASFLCAFLSLWIDLLLVYINKLYDKLWDDM